MVPLAAAQQPSGGPDQPVPEAGAASDSVEIHVKFREGTRVRLRGNQFLAAPGVELGPLEAALGRQPGLRRERFFRQAEDEIDRDIARAERRSGRQLRNLNLYYRLSVPAADAEALVAELDRLAVVEHTDIEGPPAPPPSADYTAFQGYQRSAPDGTDADFAHAQPGGGGDRVRVVDLEYAWNRQHEDLTKAAPAAALIASGTPCNPFDSDHHGTATLGVLVGDRNAFGITGGVPDAALGIANAAQVTTTGCRQEVANGVYAASTAMSPGDVLVIEQQTRAFSFDGSDYVPVEWDPKTYDAISLATANGILVVEAAGNGEQNLDDPSFGATFPDNLPDSGAIIVGAGESARCSSRPRSRIDGLPGSGSTYGQRVDVQGWGNCVTTAGYGGLSPDGAAHSELYTEGFNGTSSATAVVGAVAASLSSAIEAARGTPASPAEVRALLKATGTPQDVGAGVPSGHIGPLPNLAAALAEILQPRGAVTFVSGLAVVEAEDFDAKLARSGDDWVAGQSPAGSVAGALKAVPDNGSRITTNIAATSPELGYRVLFPSAGTYQLWLRVYGISNGNTLHAGIGGTVSATGITAPIGSWGWRKATISVPSAGEHSVKAWMREDGLSIDRLLVTADASYTPTGNGPAVSGRGSSGPDTTPPTLITRQPAPGASGVPVGANVVATFSEPMNPATLGTASFTLAPTAGGAPLAATITPSVGNATFTLNPTADLAPSTSYTATVTTAATDAAGNALAAPQSWSFTTAPAGGGTGPVLFVSGLAVVEAEDFDAKLARSGDDWVAGQSPAGSVAGALKAVPDNGSRITTNIAATSPELGYRVLFPSAGTYQLWLRVYGISNGNTLHAGIGGTVSATGITAPIGSWGWRKATISVPSAGEHSVKAWMREDGLSIDRLLVTADASYTPTGNGPAVSGRS
jgi:hypothetical protein